MPRKMVVRLSPGRASRRSLSTPPPFGSTSVEEDAPELVLVINLASSSFPTPMHGSLRRPASPTTSGSGRDCSECREQPCDAAKCSGNRHMTVNTKMVSVPSVKPPR
jgi:hypothetical protein